jgi:DNA-binding NtrC family response regulator
MAMFGLSCVRTELAPLLIVPPLTHHPVQTNCQLAGHRNLGGFPPSPRHQVEILAAPLGQAALRVPLGELRRDTNSSSGKMSPEVEREIILQSLKEAGGVIAGASGAANRLGMNRTTLYSKMKKLNISPVEFQH